MKKKLFVAIIFTMALITLAVVIAFALSLPPLFDYGGKKISYDEFVKYAESEEIVAASYSDKNKVVYIAMADSGKTMDDLPRNCDYFTRVKMPELWAKLDDISSKRQEEGKEPGYGFEFRVQDYTKTSSIVTATPYIAMMLLLTLAVIVMLFATSKLRRNQRLKNENGINE